MGNDFLQQFMAGWQMGQGRNESTRRNQELQMEQERQARQAQMAQAQAQRQAEEHQLAVEAQKIALAQAKLQAKMSARQAAESMGAQQGMEQMQASAAPGGQFTRPGAAPIPGMNELAGPPAEGTPTQPAMVNLPPVDEGGLNVPGQQVSGIELLKRAIAEQQQKRQQMALDALTKSRADAQGKAEFRDPQRAQTVDLGDRVGILDGDGNVTRTIPKGKLPGGAHNGEGGKPLLSGEISKFNDFRSGLNTLGRLTGDVEKTGAASAAGTMVPGFLTEMTGWGADAKARQAVLDQAKQVVGKAMEGGVLRKEDEAKYMRILPVINDPPSVAKAKLANLQDVMRQDAEIYLETLTAAGRDTAKVRELLGGAAPPAAGASKYKIIEVR